MTKKSEGRTKFVNMVNELRRSRRPELENAWAKLPIGYKNILGIQAGIAGWVEQGKAATPLFSLSESTRRKLLAANHKIAALAVECAQVLGVSVLSRP